MFARTLKKYVVFEVNPVAVIVVVAEEILLCVYDGDEKSLLSSTSISYVNVALPPVGAVHEASMVVVVALLPEPTVGALCMVVKEPSAEYPVPTELTA